MFSGSLDFKVYSSYFIAAGLFMWPLIILMIFLMQGTKNINDWWLARWVSNIENGTYRPDKLMEMLSPGGYKRLFRMFSCWVGIHNVPQFTPTAYLLYSQHVCLKCLVFVCLSLCRTSVIQRCRPNFILPHRLRQHWGCQFYNSFA